MLYYLIYFSKATVWMKDPDLLKVLEVSRAWNGTHHLTGLLLYIQGEEIHQKKGRFIQVLEGDEQDVKEIFEIIKINSKHDHITLLNEGYLETRNFKDWQMGFESVTAADFQNKPGFVRLKQLFSDHFDGKKTNFALNFLRSYYDLRSTIC
jgi:hypothetical protein